MITGLRGGYPRGVKGRVTWGGGLSLVDTACPKGSKDDLHLVGLEEEWDRERRV